MKRERVKKITRPNKQNTNVDIEGFAKRFFFDKIKNMKLSKQITNKFAIVQPQFNLLLRFSVDPSRNHLIEIKNKHSDSIKDIRCDNASKI